MYASDYLENKLLDHIFRATSYSMPTELNFSLLAATADDAGINMNEISGNGYARAQLNPSASNWEGTGGETSGASAGTSRQTSNAQPINFPTPTGDWNSGNPITHMGMHDQAGNLLGYHELTDPIVVNSGDPVFFDAGEITWTLSNDAAGGMTHYLINKIIDHVFRGIAYTMPTQLHVRLFTAAPTISGGGTEVSGGSYSAVQLNPSVSNWQGTGGETSGASSGTSGNISNAAQIDFTTPTADWGNVVARSIDDESANMLWFGNLDVAKDIKSGNPVFFEAGELNNEFA